MRVLIVEDDLTSRILLSELLEGYGAVHIAIDGEEALAAFHQALKKRAPYDLICLDINMPKVDGQAVLKIIRETEDRHSVRKAVILMITGDRNRESVISSVRNRCNGYLIKPIKADAIESALRKFKLL